MDLLKRAEIAKDLEFSQLIYKLSEKVTKCNDISVIKSILIGYVMYRVITGESIGMDIELSLHYVMKDLEDLFIQIKTDDKEEINKFKNMLDDMLRDDL